MSATSQSSEELGPRCPRCGGARWKVYRSTKNSRAWIRKRKCKTPGCSFEYVSVENGPPQNQKGEPQ